MQAFDDILFKNLLQSMCVKTLQFLKIWGVGFLEDADTERVCSLTQTVARIYREFSEIASKSEN